MPKNSMVAPMIGALATVLGFGITWHIWWLTIAAFVAIWATVIARSFCRETEQTIPASQVREEHEHWLREVKAMRAAPREAEISPANRGFAAEAV